MWHRTLVQAGAPLVEIGDPLNLGVVADLLSTDATQIEKGAAVRIDGWGGTALQVTRVDPAGFLKASALGIAHYPGGSSGCACRLLPRSRGLPQMAGRSASALSLSRPARASLTLRPAGSLSRSCATFVTRLQPFRLPGRAARQLPDQSTTLWVESPPVVIRAFGAHCQQRTQAPRQLVSDILRDLCSSVPFLR